jgi:hypothetical protein
VEKRELHISNKPPHQIFNIFFSSFVSATSEFKVKERLQSASCVDRDFGHVTYEMACEQLKVVPIKRVMQQLPGNRLQVNHVGFNTKETKALSRAILVGNTHLQTLFSYRKYQLFHNAMLCSFLR